MSLCNDNRSIIGSLESAVYFVERKLETRLFLSILPFVEHLIILQISSLPVGNCARTVGRNLFPIEKKIRQASERRAWVRGWNESWFLHSTTHQLFLSQSWSHKLKFILPLIYEIALYSDFLDTEWKAEVEACPKFGKEKNDVRISSVTITYFKKNVQWSRVWQTLHVIYIYSLSHCQTVQQGDKSCHTVGNLPTPTKTRLKLKKRKCYSLIHKTNLLSCILHTCSSSRDKTVSLLGVPGCTSHSLKQRMCMG